MQSTQKLQKQPIRTDKFVKNVYKNLLAENKSRTPEENKSYALEQLYAFFKKYMVESAGNIPTHLDNHYKTIDPRFLIYKDMMTALSNNESYESKKIVPVTIQQGNLEAWSSFLEESKLIFEDSAPTFVGGRQERQLDHAAKAALSPIAEVDESRSLNLGHPTSLGPYIEAANPPSPASDLEGLGNGDSALSSEALFSTQNPAIPLRTYSGTLVMSLEAPLDTSNTTKAPSPAIVLQRRVPGHVTSLLESSSSANTLRIRPRTHSQPAASMRVSSAGVLPSMIPLSTTAKPTSILSLPALMPLIESIQQMDKYGLELRSTDLEKSSAATSLAMQLLNKLKHYYEQAAPEQKKQKGAFARDFLETLHSKDEIMSTHRNQWKVILANIIIALTGVGLLALGIKYATTGYVFFGKTQSITNIEAVDNQFKKCTRPVA